MLGVELVKAEALRSMRERPNNPDAADLAMQANVKLWHKDSKATFNDAVTLAERALALDPQNVRALYVLAAALTQRVTNHWSDDPAGDIARAEKAIDAALALQPSIRGFIMEKAKFISRSGSSDHRSGRMKQRSR